MTLDNCSICSKVVKNNQQGICCDSCQHWVHAKCMFIPSEEYFNLSKCSDAWFCSPCLRELFAFNSIDDNAEFNGAIDGSDQILNRVNNLQFSPIQVSENRFLVNCEDLDPDINLYAHTDLIMPDSNYVSTLELSMNAKKNLKSLTLSLMHVNCRSINKNINNLTLLLDQL